MKTISIHVYGRVQGVWFRASTQEKAISLGLTGIVRNEPDRSVYLEVSGEDKVLENFIAWCHEGPKYARVEKVVVSDLDFIEFENFIIQR